MHGDHTGHDTRVSETQLKRLEDRLKVIDRELEHARRLAALGMILGIIAHEFNNILTPILSYSQLALENPDDRALTEKALRRAADGSEKAARIASSVLALARKDGFIVPGNQAAPVADIAHCLSEALQCLAMEPGRDGVTLKSDLEHGSSAAIDPIALQQVFINLLLNSRKALRNKRGSIRIRSSTGNNATVAIQVEDSGCGVEPEMLKVMFEPFAANAGALEAKPGAAKGTGLGLAICKQLIEAAGGSISATSTVGEGTRFEIVLPIHKNSKPVS